MRRIRRISSATLKTHSTPNWMSCMTTLTAAPLAPLLDRLFAEADAAEPNIDAAFADLSDDEQARMLRSKTDYGELYGRMKNLPLAVSRETGALLYMLARSSGARTIVEFGTSFGISTLHLAAALQRQWRRAPDHQRVRALQGGAGARQPQGGRRHRSGRDPRRRCARDAERRSARNDRPRPARRRQVALSRNPEPVGEPS